ncbi:MAG: hypothetical protein AB7U81_06560 [Thiohalomonadaceae bacterium]
MSALAQVFLLSHAGLTAFRLCVGRVCEAVHFDDSEAGRQAFARHLADAPALPAALLVDRADEEYRIETVPHILRDRAELLARHGARLFGDTPFRSARVLGREAHGRRDDRVVFSALSRPEALRPWLACMGEARVPLAAIESVAAVGTQMLPALRARGVALLAVVGTHELRQSLFENGVLLFSRLVPLAGHDPEARAQALRAELARTLHYLRRQALFVSERETSTHVVADEVLARELEQQDGTGLEITALPTLAAALACSAHAAHDPGVLMAELMARKVSNRYARKEERRHYLHWHLVRGVAAACWAGAAAAMIGTVYDVGLALGSHAIAQVARAEAAQMEMQVVDDTLVIEAARMRAEVEAADRLLAGRQSHRVLLERTGAVLAAFPEIELDALTFAQPALTESQTELALRGRMNGPGVRFDAFVHTLRSLPDHPEVHMETSPRGEAAAFALMLKVVTP